MDKTVVVRDLNHNTCYKFTIKPMFAKHEDGEEHSVECDTAQNQNES